MLSQLGGKRFMVMTGSKPQYKDTTDNPLIAFKLVKNTSKANYMKLSYISGLDLYTMEFVRATAKDFSIVNTYEGLSCDMLQSVFTKQTGLYTKL